MDHLWIVYDLCVILTGVSALSIAGFWALKTREAYLRDFCILYALFTALMVLLVVLKYLTLNIETFDSRSWYTLLGIRQGIDAAVIVAVINFFHGLYLLRFGKALTPAILALMAAGLLLTLSPAGAVLDEAGGTIMLGPAHIATSVLYLLAFTYALVIGIGFIRRVWSSKKRIFVAGLLLFAGVGYAESLFGFAHVLRNPVVVLSAGPDFLVSSIPYALYGIFLLYYFLQFLTPSSVPIIDLSDELAAQWGITGREREIILKVLQGKSNADIAGELFITLATVKTHLHNIYQKIGVDSRFDLIARVRDGLNPKL